MAEPAKKTVTAGSSTSTSPTMRPKKAPPFAIKKVTTRETWMKMLFYAMHGVGKTTLAASAVDVPSMGDVIMISAESGNLSLLDNDRIKDLDKLETIPVDSFDTVVKIYEFLTSHIQFRDLKGVASSLTREQADDKMRAQEAWMKGCEPSDIVTPKRYMTVILDSLTEIEAYCMYKLLGAHGEFSTAMLEEDAIKTAEFKEYKQNNNMVNLLVRAFRDLDMHVIVLAGRAFEQDEMKKFLYSPQLTGKLRTQVQGYFDIVGYLVAGKAKEGEQPPRRLYVQPEGRWDAKCRFAGYKLGHFDDPTLSSMMKALGRS